MERVEAESLGDVLRRAIEQNNMTHRLLEAEAEALWPRIVGETIAGHTGKATVRKGLMTVCVRSATLRNDLMMSRSSLIRILNESLGKEVVKDIRFIG